MSLTADKMRLALTLLDALLPRSLTLIVGGGGAMLLAYGFPLATSDIDAVPKGLSEDELKPLIEKVADELNLSKDWLNSWFQTFTHVLPADYATRTVEVYSGTNLTARALGRDDLLLMKCFAHRTKDIPHARALVAGGANISFVYDRIDELRRQRIPLTDAAADFLDTIVDMESS